MVLVLYWWCGWYNNVSDWINDRGSCSCLAAKTPHSQPALTSSSPILKYIQNLKKKKTIDSDSKTPHSQPALTSPSPVSLVSSPDITISLQRVFEIFMIFQDIGKYEHNKQTLLTTPKSFRGCYWWWFLKVMMAMMALMMMIMRRSLTYPLPPLPPWAVGPPEAVIILNDRPRQKTLH